MTTTDTLTAPTPTTNETPPRSRPRYESGPWDLSDLLARREDPLFERRLAELEAAVAAFETRRPELAPDMDRATLLDILAQYQALQERQRAVDAYGSLWFASDTQSQAALDYLNRVERLLTEIDNRVLFFTLWWKGLEDGEADALLPAEPEHEEFRVYLRELRRLRPYALPEDSEKIINLKDTDGMQALLRLYTLLTNRLEFELEVDGEAQTFNRSQLTGYAYSRDPDLRAAAYRELYRVFGRESTVLAQLYVHRVCDWHNEFVGLRGYPSAIAARNVSNDIPDAAVATLLEVAARNAPLFQRYFRLKAGWLGRDKLRRYDIYAPLAESSHTVEFGDAAELVLDTLERFDPRFAELAERVLAERHLDSEIRKGKRSGAFCSTPLPSLTPWVLVNFTGRVRDIAELAHELGHAIHSLLSCHHSVFNQRPSLPLAETASVFSEMLVTDRLLNREKDPLARRALLNNAVSDIYATVLRQAYFVRFEIEAHRAILAGRSIDTLYDLYLANLAEQFGDSVEVSEEFRYEWVSIPHIYQTPFYCYAYSFGQLLTLALYRRYQEEGTAFLPGYMKLLAYGGAARPQHALEEAGIDITDPAFWQGGFEVIEGMIDEMEALSLPAG